MKNGRNLEIFAAVVALLCEKPRSCPELAEVLGSEKRNTVYGHVEVLVAEGLVVCDGHTRPGKRADGGATKGPLVYRWVGVQKGPDAAEDAARRALA